LSRREVLSLNLQIFHYETVKQEEVGDGAKNAKIRWLITEKNGATHFVMRHFEVGPNGFTPLHKHPYEHEIFVLSGSGVVIVGSEEKPFSGGDVIFIPPNVEHQLRSRGKTEFLCFIPLLKKD